MRDDHYRKCCDYTDSYDKVIDLIKRENKYCNEMAEEQREEFASEVVNDCIRSVVFGNAPMWASTGGAIAIRVHTNPDMNDYKKVVLAYRA